MRTNVRNANSDRNANNDNANKDAKIPNNRRSRF
jgi:hypothetical protein